MCGLAQLKPCKKQVIRLLRDAVATLDVFVFASGLLRIPIFCFTCQEFGPEILFLPLTCFFSV